jgi:hypothetical protein
VARRYAGQGFEVSTSHRHVGRPHTPPAVGARGGGAAPA